MPVAPTYPGVYIEEIPSAVRTIVGVPTAVTAFVGYTDKGPTDKATQIFNFGDYTRAFGGLNPDSLVSYAVQQFFLNGGVEAWVVRVANGAATASVVAENDVAGGAGVKKVLDIVAKSGGVWGNNLRVDIDRNAANPFDQFNLTVTEYQVQNGALVPGTTETFRNLSMNSKSPNYVRGAVNLGSQLIAVDRDAGANSLVSFGLSQSANHNVAAAGGFAGNQIDGSHNTLLLSVDGKPPISITLANGPATTGGAALTTIATDLVAKAATGGYVIYFETITAAKPFLRFISGPQPAAGGSPVANENSSVRFSPGPQNDAAQVLKLGLLNGGIEQDGSAPMRPAETGTVGTGLPTDLTTLALAGAVNLTVQHPLAGAVPVNNLQIWTGGQPATWADIATNLQKAIRAAATANAPIKDELAGATVSLDPNALRVTAGGNPDTYLTFADSGDGQAQALGLIPNAKANVASYALGPGNPLRAKISPVAGSNGTKPGPGDLTIDPAGKKGLYALEDVDIFNLLCIPLDVASTDPALGDLYDKAIAYCEARRAFYILDMPWDKVTKKDDGKDWIDNIAPKSKNAASYFPWINVPDPLQNYRPRPFPPSGALAGLYSRTDAARGVWKAPAGTEAVLRGPVGTTYRMTDLENGVINPAGLNGIRTFPVYGHIVWGSRTLVGADAMASEWKYIPVRRVALFIEESLFRGTKWVVFEPNDEPLWAQIRLNVGAFMHDLFRKGAFQGQSPREAYLVKCDKETTTQNDINSGIVNILVGFAPLKPAEFVIIKITQLAGQVEV